MKSALGGLTSNLSGICPYRLQQKGAFLSMNGLPLLFSGIPEMPLISTRASDHKSSMWSWEERCTHIREAGAKHRLCKFNTYAIAKKRSVF